MPRGAKVYDHKDLRGQYPEPKTAKTVKALATLQILEGKEKFSARPDHGTVGQRITIVTNYLKITIPSHLHICAVKLSAADGRKIKTREQRRYVFSLLAGSLEFSVLSPYWATDFSTFIVSCVDLFDADEQNPQPAIIGQKGVSVMSPYQIRIKYQDVLSTKVLQDYTTGKSDNAAYGDILQALNAVVYQYPNGLLSSVQQVGINKFFLKDPNCDIPLKGAWVQSVVTAHRSGPLPSKFF